jgi:predicted DCC family thiol-disulfide oxidoreductase YuxK
METKNDISAVYYDGACPICSREIAMYKSSGAIPDKAFQDIATGPVPEDADRDALLARFHVRLNDGTLVSGARAFLALWRTQRVMRPVGIALDRQPFIWLLDLAYSGFLKLRKLWR